MYGDGVLQTEAQALWTGTFWVLENVFSAIVLAREFSSTVIPIVFFPIVFSWIRLLLDDSGRSRPCYFR